MDTPLAVPLAHHGSRGPANQGIAMIASDPQNMLFAHASWSVKTDRRSPFTPFMRRRDDPIDPQFDRRPLGAFSILRGGLALELPPCAWSASDDDPLSCREDLVASRDRARRPFRAQHDRELVLHGAAPTRRSRGCLTPCRTQ